LLRIDVAATGFASLDRLSAAFKTFWPLDSIEVDSGKAFSRRLAVLKARFITLLSSAALVLLSAGVRAQSNPQNSSVTIPQDTIALSGTPTIRVDTTSDTTKRRRLTSKEAGQQRLMVKVIDGRYFWANRENQPLKLETSGEFTYLSSGDPGQYIKLRRINDRISYVEHLDVGSGSVTYWGELRIELGK
jgi:hypothetical protein